MNFHIFKCMEKCLKPNFLFSFYLSTNLNLMIFIGEIERRCTWRRLLKTSLPSTPNHAHSATSTDTELSTLDTHELWLPDSR